MKHTYIVAAAVSIMALQVFAMEEKLERSHWDHETGKFIKTFNAYGDYWDDFHACPVEKRVDALKVIEESPEKEAHLFSKIKTLADRGQLDSAALFLKDYPEQYTKERSYLAFYIGQGYVNACEQYNLTPTEILSKARIFFLDSVKCDPNARAYAMLAKLYKDVSSNHEKSKEYQRKADELSPDIESSDLFESFLQISLYEREKENDEVQAKIREESQLAKPLEKKSKAIRLSSSGVSKKRTGKDVTKTKALLKSLRRSKMHGNTLKELSPKRKYESD